MPDTKFYTLLGVGKGATDDELKKAYKKAALKHHPDRGGDAAKFKEVSEAYETLSDPNKRAVYDQFGEAGLKGQPPPGASGPGGMGSNPFGAGGFSGFPGGAGGHTFSFGGASGANPFGGAGGMDPRDLFSSLFGDIGGMGGGGGRPGSRSSFGLGDDSDDAMPGAFGGGRPGASRSRSTAGPPEPATEIVKPLPVSLEDLYRGTTKRMKISRRMLDGHSEDKVLEVKVVAGYKAGTRIKFKGAGNEEVKGQSVSSQDVAFVIEEKPHPTYKREGDNAVIRFKLPLVDALTGPTTPTAGRKSITTLDGRTLPFTLPPAPIKPEQEIRIANEGFPITRKDSTKRKGDLIVRIEVVFPDRLTEAQSTAVRKALS